MILLRLTPAFFFSFLILTYYDQEWSLWLHQNDIRFFSEWFDQSLISDLKFGGSDLPIALGLFPCIFYILSLSKRFYQLNSYSWITYLPSVLVLTTVTTHALKISIGRARPYSVWSGKLEYSEWYEFGSQWIGDGLFSGSFTSGHTAATMPFLGMAFYLYHHQKIRQQIVYHIGSLFLMILAFFYIVAMAVSRSMLGEHWLTDTAGSIMIGAFWCHVLYFHILRIHEQQLFYQKYKKTAVLPKFWEVRSIGYLVGILFCFAIFIISIRAIWNPNDRLFSLLMIPASIFVYFLGRQFKLLNDRIKYEFHS